MAENNQQQQPQPGHHMPEPNSYGHLDPEAQSKQLRHKKRMKCFAYAVAFVVFQTAVILVFALTVMKVKTPKFRVRSATFETFGVTGTSLDVTMNAQLGVKNTNFGPYKFDNSTIIFFYRGAQVGSAVVPKSKANFKSTKKMNINVRLSSTSSELASDYATGIVQLSSEARLTGKVELMLVMKKKKATNMNCTMEINIASQQLQNVKCK